MSSPTKVQKSEVCPPDLAAWQSKNPEWVKKTPGWQLWRIRSFFWAWFHLSKKDFVLKFYREPRHFHFFHFLDSAPRPSGELPLELLSLVEPWRLSPALWTLQFLPFVLLKKSKNARSLWVWIKTPRKTAREGDRLRLGLSCKSLDLSCWRPLFGTDLKVKKTHLISLWRRRSGGPRRGGMQQLAEWIGVGSRLLGLKGKRLCRKTPKKWGHAIFHFQVPKYI